MTAHILQRTSAKRRFQPPPIRHIYLILKQVLPLSWVACAFVILTKNWEPPVLDVALAAVWMMRYVQVKEDVLHEKRLEEKRGIPLPPPEKEEWLYLFGGYLLLAALMLMMVLPY